MIKEMEDDLYDLFRKYGYEWMSTGSQLPGRYTLSIMRKEDSPPPLGIHVKETIRTEEKLGGD